MKTDLIFSKYHQGYWHRSEGPLLSARIEKEMITFISFIIDLTDILHLLADNNHSERCELMNLN